MLSFRIERHGGTVMGSTCAEVQFWDVDLDRCTAGIRDVTHRQLVKTAPRHDVKALASAITGVALASGIV